MTTLVVAAHPDDEVLGCGATAARLAREGERVLFAILGEGITSRYGDRDAADPQLLAALRECAERAASILGAAEVVVEELPDNRFDSVALLDVVKLVEGFITRFKPDRIFTHHPGDLNVDHGIVHRAVMTATRPGGSGHTVREVLAFEVPSSTEWSFGRLELPFRPNVFVGVSDTLELKVAAMEAYESEARAFPHPRSPEALRALARTRGAAAGVDAAEAFELVRRIDG